MDVYFKYNVWSLTCLCTGHPTCKINLGTLDSPVEGHGLIHKLKKNLCCSTVLVIIATANNWKITSMIRINF